MQPLHPHPAWLLLGFAIAFSLLAQLLNIDSDAVQEVASVHNNTIVSFQADFRLKLGVRRHKVKLSVNGDPMLEAGKSHTGVPGCCHIISIIAIRHLGLD